MRYFIILCALLLAEVVTYSQNAKIQYTYDAAGNRTSRKVVLISSKSAFVTDTIALTKDIVDERVVRLFPNPTYGVLSMDISHLDAGETIKIRVTDMMGRTILNDVQNSTNFKIDLTAQPNGFYLLSAIIGEQRKEWKIVKE